MYNDSYAAEKAWDNLYDRNEDVQPKDCPDCENGKVAYSCCGDEITDPDNDLCPTCKEHCGYEPENCETCNGEGVLYND